SGFVCVCETGARACTGVSAASATRKPIASPPPTAAAPMRKRLREAAPALGDKLCKDVTNISASQALGGFLHGTADALVGRAAAQISAHRAIDIAIGRLAVVRQEGDGR